MSFEMHKIPQGKILIAFSDKNLSIGTLELNPNQESAKHERPVLESLFQLKGRCLMRLFGEDGDKEVVLNEGDSLDIPPGNQHIHANPYDEVSLTLWKASGDIIKILDKIRENSNI
jgi:quercetin dioxygenase-like cupin family protein